MPEHNKILYFFLRWVQYWIDIFVGITGVLTLGLYRPWWDFKYIFWFSTLMTKKYIEYKKINNIL